MDLTRESQYQPAIELRDRHGFTRLGLTTSWVWDVDPIHLTFLFSRYKFVARQLAGRGRVLEVGCADGFASRIVRQMVGDLTAVDFDPVFVDDARALNAGGRWPITVLTHDMRSGPAPGGPYEAAYALDVLEHIAPADEDGFLTHLVTSLGPGGVLILGMPSLESQAYSSSKIGHVNCKTGPEFSTLMRRYFANVFPFSMNDEVVHTGYAAMAHYRFVICTERLI